VEFKLADFKILVGRIAFLLGQINLIINYFNFLTFIGYSYMDQLPAMQILSYDCSLVFSHRL